MTTFYLFVAIGVIIMVPLTVAMMIKPEYKPGPKQEK